ncbi:hypothetical protein C8R44DRAFT_856733 [Mycena epipterygia]|nr:hypothetical protein C8R44DRAFT_856733 [Mycena epipterygia]
MPSQVGGNNTNPPESFRISGSEAAPESGPWLIKRLVIDIRCEIHPRVGSLLCKIATESGKSVSLKLHKHDRNSPRLLAIPIYVTPDSKLCLSLSRQWTWLPLGKPRTSEIAFNDILSGIGDDLDGGAPLITLKLTIESLTITDTRFIVQTAGNIQLCATTVTLSDNRKGKHYLRAISGCHSAIKEPLKNDQQPQQCKRPILLAPNCALEIFVQHRHHLWSRKTRIATGDVTHSKALESISNSNSLDATYRLMDDPKIELFFIPEDSAVALDQLRQQLAARKGKLWERLDKSKTAIDYILRFATALSELNSVAKAVVGTIETIFDVCRICLFIVKEWEGRDIFVLELLEDLAGALEYVAIFSAKNLQTLQKYINELNDLSTRVVALVQKYILREIPPFGRLLIWLNFTDPTSQSQEEFTQLRSQLGRCREKFAKGLQAETVLQWTKWTDDLEKLMRDHYLKIIEQILPKAAADAAKPSIPRCLPGTREAILREVEGWLAAENVLPNILWLRGYPGAGKSCIASSLAGNLRSNPAFVSSVFFRRDSIWYTSPAALWITVASDLCRLDVSFGKQVAESLEKNRINLQTDSTPEVFTRLIADPLAACSSARLRDPIFVVVDALDECYGFEAKIPDRARIDDVLASLEQWGKLPGNFKLVVTSRDGSDISRRLAPISYPMELSLEPDDPDIRLFISHECAELDLKLVDSEWPDGRFGQPGVLSDFYSGIIDIKFPADRLRSDFPEKFRAVAGAIALSKNATDTRTIILEILNVSRDTLFAVCNRLRSVLDPPESNVLRFRHQSFVDYLLSTDCDLENPIANNPGVLQMKTIIPKHLVHASLYWSQYLGMLKKPDAAIIKVLKQFLSCNLLYWLEVLRLVGGLEAATENLLSLERYINSVVDDALSTFTRDALDFVQSFAQPISLSAPHIYLSALPFTPDQSTISRAYKHQFPNTISVSIPPAYKFDPYEEITPTAIISLSTSPTGCVAVAAEKNDQIRLWDSTTGSAVGTALLHKTAVLCICFSPDGQTIASGSEDKNVQLWKTDNPTQPIQVMEGHTEGATCVLFLGGGATIVSGSQDETIRIWDSQTGNALAEYTPHQGVPVAAIAGSSYNRFISISALGNTGHIHEFIDRNTGRTISDRVFRAQYALTCIAYSENAVWVTAGSADHTIRIWNSFTGEEMDFSPVRGHSRAVTSVAIHRNRIASGSADRTIRVWNLETGKAIAGPFHGHLDTITAITFSRDGSQIISGSKDSTVRVWDISGIGMPKESHSPKERNYMMDSKGWIRGSHGERLVWLPKSERGRVCWGRGTAIIDGKPWKRLDFPGEFPDYRGKSWGRCIMRESGSMAQGRS